MLTALLNDTVLQQALLQAHNDGGHEAATATQLAVSLFHQAALPMYMARGIEAAVMAPPSTKTKGSEGTGADTGTSAAAAASASADANSLLDPRHDVVMGGLDEGRGRATDKRTAAMLKKGTPPRPTDAELRALRMRTKTFDPNSRAAGSCLMLDLCGDYVATSLCQDTLDWLRQVELLMTVAPGNRLKQCVRSLASMVRKYARILCDLNIAKRGVYPLFRAISKMQPTSTPHSLTPAHAAFVQVALKAKCYNFAVTHVLRKDVLTVDPERTAVSALDYLLYHFYGGTLYCGMKHWQQAMHMFRMNLVIPTRAVSRIQIDSYKRLVLCSIVVDDEGERSNIFSGVPDILQRALLDGRTGNIDAYVLVRDALSRNQGTDVMDIITGPSSNVFQEDKNLGLVKSVIEWSRKRRIHRLTDAYLTLSFKDIARKANLDDAKQAQKLLHDMMCAGEISAVVSEKDGNVNFVGTGDASAQDTATVVKAFNARLEAVIKINQEINAEDKAMALNAARKMPTSGKAPHMLPRAGVFDFDDFTMGGM